MSALHDYLAERERLAGAATKGPLPCPVHPDATPWVSSGGNRIIAADMFLGECHVHCSASAKCWSGPSAWGYSGAVEAWNRAIAADARESVPRLVQVVRVLVEALPMHAQPCGCETCDAWRRVEAIAAGEQSAEREHGVTCEKVAHGSEQGHLHGPDDDGPFDVDGVAYCGRCHRVMA